MHGLMFGSIHIRSGALKKVSDMMIFTGGILEDSRKCPEWQFYTNPN